jgi:hypothetical protein
MIKEKYFVCKFPSFHGTPWKTNNYYVAVFFALCRRILSSYRYEVRVINKETGDHIIVW